MFESREIVGSNIFNPKYDYLKVIGLSDRWIIYEIFISKFGHASQTPKTNLVVDKKFLGDIFIFIKDLNIVGKF